MIKISAFGILCILLGACSVPRENDTNQDHHSQAVLLHLSPVVTVLENLPDSLQPLRIMLRNTPLPIKIPIEDHEAYEIADQFNNTRKIIPPSINYRPALQDDMGQ